jgi:hypothetical protein
LKRGLVTVHANVVWKQELVGEARRCVDNLSPDRCQGCFGFDFFNGMRVLCERKDHAMTIGYGDLWNFEVGQDARTHQQCRWFDEFQELPDVFTACPD